jgi:hypothetical protein
MKLAKIRIDNSLSGFPMPESETQECMSINSSASLRNSDIESQRMSHEAIQYEFTFGNKMRSVRPATKCSLEGNRTVLPRREDKPEARPVSYGRQPYVIMMAVRAGPPILICDVQVPRSEQFINKLHKPRTAKLYHKFSCYTSLGVRLRLQLLSGLSAPTYRDVSAARF